MLRKILNYISKVLTNFGHVFFVGSADKLPEPFTKEEEMKLVELSNNGDIIAIASSENITIQQVFNQIKIKKEAKKLEQKK